MTQPPNEAAWVAICICVYNTYGCTQTHTNTLSRINKRPSEDAPLDWMRDGEEIGGDDDGDDDDDGNKDLARSQC